MARVEFSSRATDGISSMDRITAALITGWIRKNLAVLDNPKAIGESLGGNRRWQYRIGDYRLIARIGEKKVVLLAITHGHTLPSYSS